MSLGKSRLVRALWFLVWRRSLWNEYYKTYDRVVRVTGWRSATIDRIGGRCNITICFWWFT